MYCKDVFVTTGRGAYSRRDTVICSGSTFTLSSDTTGTYLWSTGATTAAITASATGTYWVKTLTSPCTFQVDTIVVTRSLNLQLGNDTSICAGNSIILNPVVPLGSVLNWSTGASSPSIVVNSTETYWLKATSGACSSTDTIHIVVSPKPPVHLGPDIDICDGVPTTISSFDTYVAPLYLWSTGNNTRSINPSTSGTFWLQVTVAGCSGGDTINVNLKPKPHVSLGSDINFCAGESAVLSPAGPSSRHFLWSTGSTSSSITVTSTGAYWVKVDSAGCSGSDTVNVAVTPIPVVDLGPDQNVCMGIPVVFKSLKTYTTPVYLWSTTSTSPEITVGSSGKYWLSVSVNGCTGSDTVNLSVKPVPNASLGNDTVICPGNYVTLSAPEPPGTAYLWSTGSTASEILVSTTGVYSLTVILNGCTSSDFINVTVDSNAFRKIGLGPDTSLCLGEALILTVSDNSALWSNNTTGNILKVEYPGIYWVKIIENCGIVSDSIIVDYHLCDIAFPSAFTPNGDGKNDLIGVVGTLKYYHDFSLNIYNRWGERVFYTEDIYAGWDGVYNGVKQDLGTYYYMVSYSFEGKKHILKGDFSLIR